MKLLHYVSLMVERAELVASTATTQMPVARPKPKAKSQAAPSVPEISEDEEDPWMAAEATSPPTYVINAVDQENTMALQTRMGHLEGAVSEILGLLRTHQ